ncbi:N-6 DNA methylase [Candidatus Albibeggiatoa sp. nov. NOAA]|uniref:N-6 DNA methylase n=1 Tax=Candidatus Albibeggiatoa sp. nov. NOAA TaxID=3162724 RepID=UPI00330250E9|nr:SAM-dependent methyltransferase [Thiotrichaceae bacterium]
MTKIADIAHQLWFPAKSFHDQGISYASYLTELSWLWLIKAMPALKLNQQLPKSFHWQQWTKQATWEQFDIYGNVLTHLAQSSHISIANIYYQAETQLSHPKQLQQLLNTLEALNEVPLKEQGEVYERLLHIYARVDKTQLYLLPPAALVDALMLVSQPQATETIQDPLAGMGYFLVACDQYIKITQETTKPAQLQGMEQNLVKQRLAMMNCMLHGMADKQQAIIQWADSVLIDKHTCQAADVILSSLVFVNHADDDTALNNALALLKHIYQTLQLGGRAAVIVPDELLHQRGPAQQVRQELMDNCILHTVVRLPNGIFYPYSVPTQVLFFYRDAGNVHNDTQQIWCYDLRSQMQSFGYQRRLKRQHLMDFIKAYGEDSLGQSERQAQAEHWQCFDRQDLENDDLDVYAQVLPENDLESNELEALWQALEQTVQELEQVKALLDADEYM